MTDRTRAARNRLQFAKTRARTDANGSGDQHWRRFLRAAVIVVLVGTVLVACGDSSKTITIGALYPRTGPQGVGGTEELRGVQLAADWSNDSSVVQGTRIRLAEVDAARAEAVPDAMDSLVRRGVSVVGGRQGRTISED